jgi:hypothetical protein
MRGEGNSIDDPAILEEIKGAMKTHGVGGIGILL